MRPALRLLLIALLVTTAAVVEVTMLSRVAFPGATPGLVAAVVIAVAFSQGPVTGAAVGFGAGLLVDLTPPAVGLVGVGALVMCVVGYAAGLAGRNENRSVVARIGQAAALSGAVVLGQSTVASLAGDSRVRWEEVPVLVLTAAAYGAILAAVAIPVIGWMLERLSGSDSALRTY